ncbi:MAG TPA: hypothetical protein VHQ66_14640 [Myxococcota bacterium]|nr:hypothetical protein [Myxococcota bacterium]
MGLKAHSGWAALVAVGEDGGAPVLVERCRLQLVAPEDAEWAKQPYHAAHGLEPEDARELVARGVRSARRLALHELKSCVERAAAAGHRQVAAAVIVGKPMPDWSVEQILAVHFRMHQAEGVLFRDALVHAVEACGLRPVPVREDSLEKRACEVLSARPAQLAAAVAALGRAAGPPWSRDQKDAALAAWLALHSGPKRTRN